MFFMNCLSVIYEYVPLLVSSHSLTSIAGKRVVLFSYGSGCAASMFSMRFTDNTTSGGSLDRLVTNFADLKQRLEKRKKVSPEEFDSVMKLRKEVHHIGKSC